MEPALQEQVGTADKTLDARDRILDAALSLFAMRGFEGVSTTQIAKAAGITQPLIHYHFKNKEALWKAAVNRVFATLHEQFTAQVVKLPQQNKKGFLVEVIRNYVAFSARHPEFNQLLLREGTQPSERLNWLVETWLRPALEPFYDVYLEGASDGWLKVLPFPQLVFAVAAAAGSFFSLAPLANAMYRVDARNPEEALRQSDTVVDLVLSIVTPHGAMSDVGLRDVTFSRSDS
jgi:AcrR family transcriptional regulator